jgi:hypothetical protein
LLTRRGAIQSAWALAACSGLPVGRSFAACVDRPAIGIVDLNLEGAARLVDRLQGELDACHTFIGDPGLAWMNAIEPVIKSGPATIAGCTSRATSFCLHYLARDYGLGLVFLGAGAQVPSSDRAAHRAFIELEPPHATDSRAVVSWLLAPKRI